MAAAAWHTVGCIGGTMVTMVNLEVAMARWFMFKTLELLDWFISPLLIDIYSLEIDSL